MSPEGSGGENKSVVVGVSWFALFMESEQLRSRVTASRSRCRNHSAPYTEKTTTRSGRNPRPYVTETGAASFRGVPQAADNVVLDRCTRRRARHGRQHAPPDTGDDIGAGRWATPDPSNRMPQDMQKAIPRISLAFGGLGATLWFIGKLAGDAISADAGTGILIGGVIIYGTLTFVMWGWSVADERRDRDNAHQNIRRVAACDADTAPVVLVELASCDDPKIREDVARNKSTPHAILERLAMDPHRSAREAVALNSSVSEDLLLRIVEAGDPVVCSAMLNHDGHGRRSLPQSVRSEILQTAVP